MALTINPAVSGGYPNFTAHAASFLAGVYAGALAAAVATMVAYTALAAVLADDLLVAIAVGLICWAVLQDLGLPMRLPYRPGQVPEWFRQVLPAGAVAALFGMQLGVGFLTFFTYSTQLAMLVAIPFLQSLGDVLLVIGLFALGKSLVLLVTIGVSAADEVAPRFRWGATRHRALRLTTATVSLSVAAALITGGVGS